jgi:APA family basic amino acid/polyamine antiporter
MGNSSKRGVFVREATGLVRELSWFETFGMNMTFINVVGGFLVTLLFLYYFPGANIPLTFALGAIPTVGLFLVYSIFGAAMPRSGGDYLFTGRVLGQPIGFAQGFINLIGFYITTLGGFNAWLAIYVDAPPFLYSLGLTTGNKTLINLGINLDSNLALGFTLSTLAIIIGSLIVIFGIRLYKIAIRYLFGLYLSFALILLVLLTPVTHSSFVEAYNRIAGNPQAYTSTLTGAGPLGVYTPSLTQTLLAFIPLGFLTYTGFQSSVLVGGEIKNVRKTQTLALGGAIIVTAVILTILSLESVRVFGSAFLQAVSNLWALSPSKLPIQITPYVTFYLTFIYQNPVVAFILNFLPILGNFLMLPSVILVGSRLLFAWSFDRIIPEKLASVNERFHSPILSVIILALCIEAWTYVLYFQGIVTSWLTLSLFPPVAWMLTGIAALLFPFIKREMYNSTVGSLPGWFSKKVGGLPMLSIGGIILIATMLTWIYQQTVPIIAFTYLGSSLVRAYGLVIGFFVAGLIIFYAAKIYHKRKSGIDISLASMELPPE